MKNFVNSGDTIDHVATGTITSGDVVQMGSDNIPGIATISGVSGDVIPVKTGGVWTLAKPTGQAWTQMVPIYWDSTAKVATTAAASGANKKLGHAYDAAGSGATSGNVRFIYN